MSKLQENLAVLKATKGVKNEGEEGEGEGIDGGRRHCSAACTCQEALGERAVSNEGHI